MRSARNRTRFIGAIALLAAVVGARWTGLTARRRPTRWPSRDEFAEMDAGTLNEYFASIGADVRVQDRAAVAKAD
jgi:hypothetical protein